MTFDRAYHWWNLTHAAVLTVGTLLVAVAREVGAERAGGMIRAVGVVPVVLPLLAAWSALALGGLYLASRRLRAGAQDPAGDAPGGGDAHGSRNHHGSGAAGGAAPRGHWIPDALTAGRGVAAVAVLVMLPQVAQWPGGMVWAVGSALAVVELTDFFDGRLARRFGPSAFGALWDMENDALFTLSLSLFVYLRYGIAPFVLLLGLMRYLYVLIWRFNSDPVTVSPAYKLFAKTTAAAIVVTLIVAVAPILPDWLRAAALAVVLGMQLVSFGWDLGLQYRAVRLTGNTR